MTKTVHRSATSLRRRSAVVSLLTALALLLTNFSGALAAVGVGDATTTTTSEMMNLVTITIAKPAGVVAGDVLVAQVSATRQSSTDIPDPTVPSGWTQHHVLRANNGDARIFQGIYYKFISDPALEPTGYTWTIDGEGMGTIYAAGGIIRFTNADNITPIGAVVSDSDGSTTMTIPAVPAPAGSRVAAFFARRTNGGIQPPAGGMDSHYNFVNNSGSSGPSMFAGSRFFNTTTTASAVTSSSNTGGSARWIGAQVVINPDATAPSVSMTSSATDPTNSTSIPVVVQFSESVTGFAIGDITAVNGTVSNFAVVDGDTYTFNLIPSGDGEVEANIAAGVATDSTGNGNTAANFSITYDGTAPVPQITSSESSPTNASPIPVTINFGEDVTGLDADEIVVSNGTVTNLAENTPGLYTFDLAPAGDGEITVNIAASVATDLAGNANLAATQFSITYDGTAPTPQITSSESSPTNASPIPVSINFGEDVIGLEAGEIVVNNGTVTNLAENAPGVYTFDLVPAGDGEIKVNVGAGVATDLAGNANLAATQFSITYDGTAPTVGISSSETSPTNNAAIPVTVQFSEDVTGFTAGDLTITNGSANNFQIVDANTYTFDLVPSADGAITVDIAASVATDLAGNGNLAATQFSITYDGTAPTVTMSSSESSPTNNAAIPVTIQFSEDVIGFTSSDLTIGNGVVSNFQTVDANTYTFDLVPAANGAVTVDIAAGVASDAASNGNVAASQFSIIYDAAAPTATIAVAAGQNNPTNQSPINFTVTFNEPINVGTFTSSDISFAGSTVGGTLSAVINENAPNDGTSFNISVTGMTGVGNVVVSLPAGSVFDPAGNANLSSNSATVLFESEQPAVSISSVESSPTNNTAIPMTVQFSEDVVGFEQSDLTIGNGSATVFQTVNASTYTFDLVPAADGVVTVNIAAGVAQDPLGNENLAATQFSITYDGTAPTVGISSGESSPTNNAAIPVMVEFSEDVTGFDTADLTIGNGTASNFTAVDGNTYTFDLVPAADGVVTVNIAGNAATDAAGNGNVAATQFSITYDGTAPAVTVSSTAGSPTNKASIPVTVEFGEDVIGFDASDLTIGNGTANNFAAVDGHIYTFDLVPAADGEVTVNIAAGAAVDAANNGNAAAVFIITYDATLPTVTISSNEPSPTNNPLIPVTVEFSEDVTGLLVEDLVIGNGSIIDFEAVDGNTYTFILVPASDGLVAVSLPANQAVDAAGNGNLAADEFTIVYEEVAPSVTMTSTVADPTNVSPIPVTVQFSKLVTGFTAEDIVATNGTVSNFVAVDGDTYTFDLTPAGQGVVAANIAAGVAFDAANNPNTAALEFKRTYDSVAPTVTINKAADQADPARGSSVVFVVTFSEPVNGFTSADVVISGSAGATIVTVAETAPNNGTTYLVTVSDIPNNGTVIATVPAGGAFDAAGNGNLASTSTDNEVAVIVNVAPVAENETTVAAQGEDVNITLTGTDEDGDDLTFIIVDGPDHGTLDPETLSATCDAEVPNTCTVILTYTHDGSNTQSDRFTFKVNDGRVDSAVATVSITIEPTDVTGFDNFMVLPYLINESGD